MKTAGKKGIAVGISMILVFILWTILIQKVDVQPVGQNGTDIGFASVNTWFHQLTGVHMWIYTITDWLGLVPIVVCACFGFIGLTQWIRRRSLKKVDPDIILLGLYYILVILGYLIFEMIPINFRPIPIDGAMEASYPSSTTRKANQSSVKTTVTVITVLFTALMVIGRTVAGVHWLTDILGAVFLSMGLYFLYRSVVLIIDQHIKEKSL